MARSGATKQDARRLYVTDGLSGLKVAEELDIAATTFGRWKKAAKEAGDDWDLAKSASALSNQGAPRLMAISLERVAQLANKIADAIENDDAMPVEDSVALITKLADAMNKVVSAGNRLAPEISRLGVAQDVLKRFGDYIREHHPDQAMTFLEAVEPFGEKLVEIYA